MKLERRSVFGWPATAAGSAPCTNGIVVHYDGSNLGLAGKPHPSCQAYWKATRKFHMGPARGWLDIGYSFGVCPHGIVMEGRGWQHQQAAQPGGNSTWTSVTFCSGDAEEPTAAQVEAFAELRAWLRGKGLAAAISYHGKFISTSCPGKILRGMVTGGQLAGAPAKPPAPKPSTAPPFPGRILIAKSPEMHGADVLAYQRQMRKRGWSLAADSYYGPKSAAVTRGFQAEKGLTADGEVGPITWRAAFELPVN